MNAGELVFPAFRSLDPDTYEAHPIHRSDRIWSQTNCYVDLWVEVLHSLGADPIPAVAVALGSGFDGRQWNFVKFQPEDLRDLYGIRVDEANIWKPYGRHLVEYLSDGVLCTVEVDSFHLPDTAGINYRTARSKTTIVPIRIDLAAEEMLYFHNSGLHALGGEDFRRVMALDDEVPLPPYIERIGIDFERLALGVAHRDVDLTIARAHLERRPHDNPVAALADRVKSDLPWIKKSGPESFHLWSFGTLRQCGFTAELAADLVGYLGTRGIATVGNAEADFLEVSAGAKSVQFKLARAARGRDVDVDDALEAMSAAWQRAMNVVVSSLVE